MASGSPHGSSRSKTELAHVSEARARIEAANAQLREAEERFRLTIDEAPIGMALVALDGRFIRVNRALCEIVGYTADELMGLTFQAITHPDDLDTDVALARRLISGEVPRYRLGKRYIRKDGTVVDVMLSVSVLRGADGAPVHFISQIEDVTEQKRAEAAQRFLAEVGPALASTLDYEETLARLAALSVQSFADLCFVDLLEDDDEVRRVKLAARDPAHVDLLTKLMDLSPGSPRPRVVQAVLETRQPILISRVTDEVVASLSSTEEQIAFSRATGIQSVVAVPLLARDQLLGAVAFASSTPARVYGPADLRVAEELAQRAARAIENARLYRTARRATQARDDVLGVVAHDLRSPLGIILMQAAVLRRRERAGASKRESGRRPRTPADVIERAATRMNRLIQDLLDVTRIDAKRLRIEPANVSTDRLVADLVEAHRPAAASVGIELVTELAPDLPEVWADRDRLLQVFENLLGNALKFTPGGGRITVGAERRGGDVLFRVSDTGSGIRREHLAHVFDRFWQGGTGVRRGAGLGLPIVKGIIEAHRGSIGVDSAPGRGTTFSFSIPVAPRAPECEEAATRERSGLLEGVGQDDAISRSRYPAPCGAPGTARSR